MPRQSVVDLATKRPQPAEHRLSPPSDLGKAERGVWAEIVGACQADHFERSDAALLRRYVENVVLARQAAKHLAARAPWSTASARHG